MSSSLRRAKTEESGRLPLMAFFSVSSFFSMSEVVVESRSFWGSLWSTKAPPRVIAFGWSALLGGVLTMDNLRRRKVIVVNACSMCLASEESIDPLLLNCPLAKCIWRSILSWFYSCGPLPNSIPSLFDFWRLGVGSKR